MKSNPKLFLSRKIEEFIHPEQVLITLSPNDTIEKAFLVLSENNILSAPVIEPISEINGKKKHKFYGFFGMIDIVNLLMTQFEQFGDEATLETKCKERFNSNLSSFLEKNKLTPRNIRLGVEKGEKIEEVLKVFAKGLQRIALSDEDDEIHFILSQSNIIQGMAKHIESLGDWQNKSASELNLLRKVYQLDGKETTLRAFQLLQKHNLSTIAIINSDGQFINALHVSDLKGIATLVGPSFSNNFPSIFRVLLLPIEEYLQLLNKKGQRSEKIIEISPESSLKSIVTKMATHHSHVVFFVNEKKKPVGVVGLTDLCRIFFLAAYPSSSKNISFPSLDEDI